ncbi:hypothetical protein ACF0H5_005568 [Mactra antiquata]
MSDGRKTCCFKSCDDVGLLEERIEVKTVLQDKHSKLLSTFLIGWHANGEAEFHTECWEKVLALYKSRKTKNTLCMHKEEKLLVKIAANAPEKFDSVSSIIKEAKKAASWIKKSKHCIAFTGAGISTAAGIGDFRGKSGKWTEEDQNHVLSKTSTDVCSTSDSIEDEPPCKKSKLEPDRAESPGEIDDDEVCVPYEKLRPTYTHEALHKLMIDGHLKFIISQNGDGLHGLSGVQNKHISELHGNVFMETCEKCEHKYTRNYYVMDDVASQYYEEIEDLGKSSLRKPKHAKKCELCGLNHRTGRKCEQKGCESYLKDTIINFHDNLDIDVLSNAEDEAEISDVILCLGTTLKVYPAADLVMSKINKDKLVICNRQETELDTEMPQTLRHKASTSDKLCRVYGDCDFLMKEIMQNIYLEHDLKVWDDQRSNRMKVYDAKRY